MQIRSNPASIPYNADTDIVWTAQIWWIRKALVLRLFFARLDLRIVDLVIAVYLDELNCFYHTDMACNEQCRRDPAQPGLRD